MRSRPSRNRCRWKTRWSRRSRDEPLREGEQLLVDLVPAEPGELVVLAPRVVVAPLRAPELVAAEQHRHALREQQRDEEVAHLPPAQRDDRRIVGRALDAVVPGAVVVRPVAVALQVRLVVLAVVGDEVGEREAVVGGDEVDRGERPPPVLGVEVGRAGEPPREVGHGRLRRARSRARCRGRSRSTPSRARGSCRPGSRPGRRPTARRSASPARAPGPGGSCRRRPRAGRRRRTRARAPRRGRSGTRRRGTRARSSAASP